MVRSELILLPRGRDGGALLRGHQMSCFDNQRRSYKTPRISRSSRGNVGFKSDCLRSEEDCGYGGSRPL